MTCSSNYQSVLRMSMTIKVHLELRCKLLLNLWWVFKRCLLPFMVYWSVPYIARVQLGVVLQFFKPVYLTSVQALFNRGKLNLCPNWSNLMMNLCSEDPNNRSSKDVQHLGPATDFYKRLALDCSGQQIAVDLFLLNSQYSDLATLCEFFQTIIVTR